MSAIALSLCVKILTFSFCLGSWLVSWLLSVCQVFNLTGGALSFLPILLRLTLLFQWLFHCVLILFCVFSVLKTSGIGPVSPFNRFFQQAC